MAVAASVLWWISLPLRALPTRLRTKSGILRKLAALLRVVRRDHRIVRWQPPAPPVLIGRHIEFIPQMALEHLKLLAIFEADDVARRHGSLNRYCGLRKLCRRPVDSQLIEHLVNALDQRGQLRRWRLAARELRGDYFRHKRQQFGCFRILGHFGFLSCRVGKRSEWRGADQELRGLPTPLVRGREYLSSKQIKEPPQSPRLMPSAIF